MKRNNTIKTKTRISGMLMILGAVLAPALGGVVNESGKLLAFDGAEGQEFGNAVASDNGIIAVGARGDHAAGTSSGAAYLYDAATGEFLVKLVAADGAAGDELGFSIAISDGIVAVGSPYDDENGVDSGSVYLFDASTGAQLSKLTPDDASAGDEFGNSVSIRGGVVAVGAIRDDDLGDSSGSAYLFDASTGAQIDKLLPEQGGANQSFGVSIAIDDGIVAVGSRTFFVLGDGFTFAKAYLFDASTGDQLHELQADIENFNGDQGGHFGDSIDIDDGLVVVGAWARSIFFDHSGAAYVFDVSTGAQVSMIFPGDGHDRDHFGISVAIESGVVAIGSHQDGDNGFNSGSAYLFDATSGSQMAKLLADDGAEFDYFGQAIDIDSGRVVVGAVGDEDNGSDSGSVYVFSDQCTADISGDGVLDFFDISEFLSLFGISDPAADMNSDGMFDFFDISAFLTAFSAGCP